MAATPTSLKGETGKTGTFTYAVSPDNATDKDVTVESKDEAIATITVSGTTVTVTYVKAGTTEIDGTTKDGNKTFAVAVEVDDTTAEG